MSSIPGIDLHYTLKLEFLEAVFGCRYENSILAYIVLSSNCTPGT